MYWVNSDQYSLIEHSEKYIFIVWKYSITVFITHALHDNTLIEHSMQKYSLSNYVRIGAHLKHNRSMKNITGKHILRNAS